MTSIIPLDHHPSIPQGFAGACVFGEEARGFGGDSGFAERVFKRSPSNPDCSNRVGSAVCVCVCPEQICPRIAFPLEMRTAPSVVRSAVAGFPQQALNNPER